MGTFIYKVLRSFGYAGQGIVSMVTERNMQVHLMAALIVVFLGNLVRLSRDEWFIILIVIAAVFALEMVNTAVEELANIVRDELKLSYKATQRARDVAAGAVLVMAVVAAIIGTTIFLPKILTLLSA